MKTLIFLIFIPMVLFTGCKGSAYEITAKSDLKKYSMVMSSHPGLPISFKVSGDVYDSVEVTVDKGTILLWNDRSGAVSEHGDKLSFDKKEDKLYWSPGEKLEEDAVLYIIVYKDGKKAAEKKYVIEYTGDNMFSFIGD